MCGRFTSAVHKQLMETI